MTKSHLKTVPERLLKAGFGYEELFVRSLFATWTKHLIIAGQVKDSDHVLDVACGTGILARDVLPVVGQFGRVLGVDPAVGMIETARKLVPQISWFLGKAEKLEWNNESFDCVLSQFGMMFFEDKELAATEMYRVLKPGGRLALSVWSGIEENPAYSEIISILQNRVGAEAADPVAKPFSLSNYQQVVDWLSVAGFEVIKTEIKVETACFPSTGHIIEAEIFGWLPHYGIELPEGQLVDIIKESTIALSKYETSTGKAKFPTTGVIISARKPF